MYIIDYNNISLDSQYLQKDFSSLGNVLWWTTRPLKFIFIRHSMY